jgi:hypothetical protein
MIKRKRYELFISEYYWTRGTPEQKVHWKAEVLADSRTEALGLVELPDFTDVLPEVKKVSVVVGEKGSITGSASRLYPIQITIRE